MTEEELEEINNPTPDGVHILKILGPLHTYPRPGRTLMYGYDMDRESVHIYHDSVTTRGDVRFVIHRYGFDEETTSVARVSVLRQSHLPSKRAYSECCDFRLAKLIQQAGLYVNYTRWQKREKKDFYGKLAPQDAEGREVKDERA